MSRAGTVVQARLVRDAGERAAAYAVRARVFVHEQQVPPEIERDDLDDGADHALGWLGADVVAAGRLVADAAAGTGVVGRMAVLPTARGCGVGAAVLRTLEARARERLLPCVVLHAQTHAAGFYRRAGYTAYGGEYEEAGIRHVSMRKPMPVVRDARDEDGPALEVLIGACWAQYPGCVLDVDREEPWLRAPASAYAEWRGRLWVAELDGTVVASVGLQPEGPAAVSLHSLYVASHARRQGLASELVARVETEAVRRGAGRVELWSDSRFADAHRLYTRLGYEQLSGSRDLHDLSDTVEYPFGKDLSG